MSNATAPRDAFWSSEVPPLVHWTKFQSKDIDDVHAHMSKMFCQHRLDTEGGVPPLNFRHNQIALKSITFNATDYGNPYGRIVIDIPPMDQIYLVQFSLMGTARIIQNGQAFDLEPHQMCVLSADARVRQIFEQGYRHFTVKIPKSDLEAVLAQEVSRRPGRLVFSPAPVCLNGAAASFAHLIRTICEDVDSGISAYTHARTCGAAEDILKRLLLTAAPHNLSDLFDAAPSGAAPYYVRRTEEYIRQNAGDPISLADMIQISGVSARSLHDGFRRFRNTTPMGYLKSCRLEFAHRQLVGGIDRGLTVTDIALACGFTHLSKFARDYQERFGERPSATLKRMHTA